MNLPSFTFASVIRAGLMLTLIAGVFIAYEHFRTQALFTRTVGTVMQAMNMQLTQWQSDTRCLTKPDEATLAGLEQAGLLKRLDTDLPWQLSIDYDTNSQGQVMATALKLEAATEQQGEQLRQFAPSTGESWTYSNRTLTLKRSVLTPHHEVMRQEFDPITGCFAW